MRNQRLSSLRAASFTLIELLVVVAIIAVLAAILLPSLQKAKDQSKRVVCMGHLKQVATALLILADDNDGWINGINAPVTTNNDAAIDIPNYWCYRITNYLGNSDALVRGGSTACPGKSRVDGTSPYGANCAFAGLYTPPMHSLKEVTHPTRLFLLTECYTTFEYSPTLLDYTCVGLSNVATHHNAQGLNFVFVDGHGEWVKSCGEIAGITGNFNSQWWWGRDGGIGSYGPATLWCAPSPYCAWWFGGWYGE